MNLAQETSPIRVNVELTAMCTSAIRPVDVQHLGAALASGAQRVIDGAGIVEPASLESSGDG